jgi:hypothetical protein
MQSLNKPLLIIIALILVSANIYAPAVCWDYIECDKVSLPSGVIMSYEPEIEIVCEIAGLNLEMSAEGKIEVEVLQPGYNGATLKQNLLINRDFININGTSIFFYLGRAMSPTYVNCYDTANINGQITRQNSLKNWVISFSKTWYESISPIPKAETWIVDSQNQIENKSGTIFDVNAVTTATIKDTNIIKTYENLKSDETNWFFYGVSLFMFIIGLLLIFTTVIAYTKRR